MILYPKSMTHRVDEIDLLRGVAIVCMVTFHWFMMLDMRYHSNYLANPTIDLLGQVARALFVFLIGVSTALSQQKAQLREDNNAEANGLRDENDFLRRQFRRVGFLALYAVGITLVTMYLVPDRYVQFGILHYMAVALTLLTLFAYKPRTVGPVVPVLVGMAMLVVYFNSKGKLSSNPFYKFVLGYRGYEGTIDIFPLFKWFWLSALGLLAGSLLYQKGQPRYTQRANLRGNPLSHALVTLGKYSLEIYLLHFAVIYGVQGALVG